MIELLLTQCLSALALAYFVLTFILLNAREYTCKEPLNNVLVVFTILYGCDYTFKAFNIINLVQVCDIILASMTWCLVGYLSKKSYLIFEKLNIGRDLLKYSPASIAVFKVHKNSKNQTSLKCIARSDSMVKDFGFDPLNNAEYLDNAESKALLDRCFDVLTTGVSVEAYEDVRNIKSKPFTFIQNIVKVQKDIVLVTWNNVTALKLAQTELERKAFKDELTGLNNRHAIHNINTLDECFTGALYIDLDRFKLINDTLGHDVGDIVLKFVVARLETLLDARDVAFRLGGDEFFILVTSPDTLEGIVQKSEQILEAIQRPFIIQDRELRIDASIGVVDRSAGNINEMMRAADIAMYRAKETGGICCGWTKALIDRQVEKEKIQIELQNLRDRYNCEFELYYQPIVNLNNPKEIICVEALLRWESSNLGWVSPGDFIPIAEDLGEISRITSWVLQHAINQVSEWGYKTHVSINVSPQDLEQSNFISNLKQYCKSDNVPYNLISLEITERAVAGNLKYYEQVLNDLSHMDISLKIDDFGIGDSSLKRLLDAPWKTIKIDRSLIPQSSLDIPRMQVCKALLSLCQDLNISIIAEGIETQIQHELLLSLGITQGQGFLFYNPMKADDILHILN